MTIRNKTYLLVAGFFILSFMICLEGAVLLFPEFSRAFLRLKDARANNEYLEQNLANFSEFQERKTAFLSFYPVLDDVFIDPYTPVDFFIFLENEAKRHLVDIDIMPLSLSKEDLSRFSAAFQISAKGEVAALLRFFKRVELSPYLFEISEIKIARVLSDRPGQTTLLKDDVRFTFSLKALKQK